MAEAEVETVSVDLREFVKDYQEKVVTFCFYFMPPDYVLDDLVISIFRQFGEDYRRYIDRNEGARDPLEMKIRLFRFAWERIQDALIVESVGWPVGRDFRKLKSMDENLLREWERWSESGETTLPEDFRLEIGLRLRRIDSENRAAVILKDILGFEDEEVMRMLSLRWGVYRHRLHRGRLDLGEVLKGTAGLAANAKSDNQPVSW